MANSGSIIEIVNQAAVQAATVVMMAFRDSETGHQPATMPIKQNNLRQRYVGMVLEGQGSTGVYQIGMLNC